MLKQGDYGIGQDQELEYVGFWLRFGATIIDSVILLLITIPLLLIIYGNGYWLAQGFIIGFWDLVINWILPAFLVIYLWQWKQATPGKMAFKAIIVDEFSGNSPTLKQWIIRYLGYFVSIIPFFLGCFWVAWDSKKQGWHDKLAGTVVVRPKDGGIQEVRFDGADKLSTK